MSFPTQNSDRAGSSRGPMDDPSSPYFLHFSDNPGLVLVSQALCEANYTSWSRSMMISLSVKNKLGFIDGTITKSIDENDVLMQAWTRNNNIVLSWLFNSISKEISASVIFAESARDVWLDLKDRFQQRNATRIFKLRRELMKLTQEQMSVNVYFTKMKAIWEELTNYRPSCTFKNQQSL